MPGRRGRDTAFAGLAIAVNAPLAALLAWRGMPGPAAIIQLALAFATVAGPLVYLVALSRVNAVDERRLHDAGYALATLALPSVAVVEAFRGRFTNDVAVWAVGVGGLALVILVAFWILYALGGTGSWDAGLRSGWGIGREDVAVPSLLTLGVAAAVWGTLGLGIPTPSWVVWTGTGVLFVLGIAGYVLGDRWRDRRWSALAQALAWQAPEPTLEELPVLEGTWRGQEAEVEVEEHRTRRASFYTTRVRVEAPSVPEGAAVRVAPATSTGRLEQALGDRDVEIGSRRFDERFEVDAEDPALARRLLAGFGDRIDAEAGRFDVLRAEDGALVAEQAGFQANVEQTRHLLDLLAELASATEGRALTPT